MSSTRKYWSTVSSINNEGIKVLHNVYKVWKNDDNTGSNKTQLYEKEELCGAGIIRNYIYFLPITVNVIY